jgi:DNA-binding HxlR family transcriptional regulator
MLPALLIYYLRQGTRRFGELRRDNPTISHRMLILELRKREEVGIVSRTEFAGYPRDLVDMARPGRSACGIRDTSRAGAIDA